MSALKTVQAYYTYFNNQDWEGMLSLLDPAIRHEVNQGEAQVGVDTFRAFL